MAKRTRKPIRKAKPTADTPAPKHKNRCRHVRNGVIDHTERLVQMDKSAGKVRGRVQYDPTDPAFDY